MKFKNCIALAAALAAGLLQFGCSNDDNLMKQQLEAAKKGAPPTPEQLKAGFARLEANHAQGKQEEADWAKAHPDKVAAVNAARAQSGKPPLGQ